MCFDEFKCEPSKFASRAGFPPCPTSERGLDPPSIPPTLKMHTALAPLPSPLPSASPSELQLYNDPEPEIDGTIVDVLVAACTPFIKGLGDKLSLPELLCPSQGFLTRPPTNCAQKHASA